MLPILYIYKKKSKTWCDVIHATSRYLLKVLVDPVTGLRTKRFKKAFNELFQDT